jgi:hypothetical protein
LFDFVRGIRLAPVGSGYFVGRGSVSATNSAKKKWQSDLQPTFDFSEIPSSDIWYHGFHPDQDPSEYFEGMFTGFWLTKDKDYAAEYSQGNGQIVAYRANPKRVLEIPWDAKDYIPLSDWQSFLSKHGMGFVSQQWDSSDFREGVYDLIWPGWDEAGYTYVDSSDIGRLPIVVNALYQINFEDMVPQFYDAIKVLEWGHLSLGVESISSVSLIGSSYSVGRGNAAGQYAVVDDESGRTVSYQDSLAEAERYAREANADAGESELPKFPLSAIFRGYVQAKEHGYRGSVKRWMQDMGVEVASSRRMVASQASPASVDALTGFEAKDPELEALLATPIKEMPRYRFLLNDGDFQLYEDGTLEDLIRVTVQAPGFRSFFSKSGGKPVGFYAYQQTSDSILNIQAFSLVGGEVFNGTLSRDLFNLVSSNVERYNIEWYAAPENGANEFYKRVAWWYGAEDPTVEVDGDSTAFHYFIPAGSVKLRGGHRKETGASFRTKVQGQEISSVLDLRGGDSVANASGGQKKGFGEETGRYVAGNVGSGGDGHWELEPVNSATAQELLDANDNPNFYHRADHLAATKAVGGSELVRTYANTLELRTKSEHFAKNQTYYRQWVLFKDFHVIAKDKKIPFESAVDYSINFGDVNIRCSCPSHKYHGFAYMGDQLQYLYGLPREKRFPKIRNPQLQNATCFVAGTVVTTKTGLVPIESLRVGDVVLTHLGNWKPVVATWDRTVAKSVVVKAGSERIPCTADHPWFLLRGFSTQKGFSKAVTEFGRADSITFRDRVLAPRFGWGAVSVRPAWAFMLGLYLSDGSGDFYKIPLGEGKKDSFGTTQYPVVAGYAMKSFHIAFNTLDQDAYVSRFKSMGLDHYNVQKTDGTHRGTFCFTGYPDLVSFILEHGGANNLATGLTKFISEKVFDWDRGSILSFVQGYFWGDGTIPNSSGSKQNPCSVGLIHGVNQKVMERLYLLVRNLFWANFSFYDRKPFKGTYKGQMIYPRRMYCIQITGDSLVEFLDSDPDILDIKHTRHHRFGASKVMLWDDTYYVRPAQVVERSSEPVKVYGIEVEGDHSYCVGFHGWAVKNCKHIHMALEEILSSKEKIVKMFSEYYKRLPSVPADTMIAIPAPKEGEESAEPEVTAFEETGDVDVVLPEKTEAERELEPEVISIEDPKSPGTVYVDTKLAEENLPEDQRFKYSGDGEDAADEGGSEAAPPVGGEVPEEEVEAMADEIDEVSVAPRSDDERFTTEWAWQGLRRSHVGG